MKVAVLKLMMSTTCSLSKADTKRLKKLVKAASDKYAQLLILRIH